VRGKIHKQSCDSVIQDTVFISPVWMVNVMKGLVRHDQDFLLDFFMKNGNKKMARRVRRLCAHGRLHEDLIPYLWPASPNSYEYWVSVKGTREGEIWTSEVISTPEDTKRAIGLLESFNLILYMSKDREYMVPSILKSSRKQLSNSAFYGFEFSFTTKYEYTSSCLPDGAMDSLVVRIAQGSTHAEYANGAAAFYKLGHMCQVFCIETSGSNVRLAVRYVFLRTKHNFQGSNLHDFAGHHQMEYLSKRKTQLNQWKAFFQA
jgi:hypothetical protein